MKMKCTRIRELLSNNLDNELSENELQVVSEHLKVCSECREFFEKIKTIDAEITRLEPRVVPENFSRKVIESLNKKQSEIIIQGSMFWKLKYAAAYGAVAGVVLLSLFFGNFIGRFLFKEFFSHRIHNYYQDPRINVIAESHVNKDGISYAVFEQTEQEVHND
jgi:anti-sigma factor RsiW